MFWKVSNVVIVCLLLMTGMNLPAQTFEISPQNPPPNKSKTKTAEKPKASPKAAAPSSQGGIGWGSGIETARGARAAQEAIKRGDYNAAVEYATRAANSAPHDANLWFGLGYAARLAGRYQVSVDAYQRGLQNAPSSVKGMSGLAQTYARMGHAAEAQDLLKKVIASNPKSVLDLQLAGELALSSDPNAALDLLRRAENLQASARSELLIARAYQRLNKPQEAKQYLDRAQSRAPNDPNVLRAVAASFREAHDYDQAIATLQKAVANTKVPGAIADLAYTYQLAGKKKMAADTYARAASKAPRDNNIQLSAAQAMVNVNDFDKADALLKHAEGLNPDHYRLHAIRGQIAGLLNKNDDAIREYKFAFDHLPPEGVPEGPLYSIQLRLSLFELYRATQQQGLATEQLDAARSQIGQLSGVDDASRPEFFRLRSVIEANSNDYAAAEKDIQQAQALDPNSVNIMLNYANLLWKMERKQDAAQMYAKALAVDPNNHAGLTAMGYLSREIADAKTAEKYFIKLVKLYPNDYVPYLALGDLYTSDKQYADAQKNYEKAHELAPNNPAAVSGGINAALQAKALPVAKNWIDRASTNAALIENPQVMREHERYLTLTGKYEESAALGYKVLEKLPHDPEAPVYLAYDLLFLGRHEEAFAVVQKYEPILPKDKDLRLVAGYVHAHFNQLPEAVDDFTHAIELAPDVPTSYMNRGFVLNDMKQASRATKDFETAIRLRPQYGEAHLGLAYAYLQLHRSKPALKEIETAAQIMGESNGTHLARAEAYRQQLRFRQAETEYRAALKLSPNNPKTHIALATTLYRLHRYDESIKELQATLTLSPDDPMIYAQMARAYAELGQREDTYRVVALAEKSGENSQVLLFTGSALLTLGDEQAAMTRYSRALEAPDSDRVETRLAIARLFARQGKRSEAQQQVSLALAEVRVEDAGQVTPENLVEAASVLMSIQEFDLAKQYYARAQTAGADDELVAVGMSNAYLALGETRNAGQLLRSVGPDNEDNYDYLVALSNVYRQQQENTQALSTLARANRLVEGNDSSERTELFLASQEGRQINEKFSVIPQATFGPIFEDINIYTLDAKLRGITDPSLLPPPRSSYESIARARYRVHLSGWPTITGLVEERNARGSISIPSELLIQDRNTYDTIFNAGINPVLHFGNNSIVFTPGVQFTIRRDTADPRDLNQNLFRQYLYANSNSFFNWVSFSGTLMREAGPFTDKDLHSRDLAAKLEFVVGRPWGKTALITGYEARDVLFRPLIREYFTTSTYAGIQRKFGDKVRASIIGEYVRSWRVQDDEFALAQAIRPGVNFEYMPNMHWTVQASGAWSQGEGFHDYDNIHNQVLISYVRSVQRPLNDGMGEVPVSYPWRFSFGVEQQTFYSFAGGSKTKVLPVLRLTLF
jgi:tetratricopeptide (TPR) repeat protein